MRPTSRCTVLLCLSVGACLLCACGGGGSSGSSGYTIGGTVSGLTQLPGVVLENNGGDPLTVSTSGSFNFSTPVASGQGYDVTVETSPAGQSCQIASGAQGTATARVTSVSVVCTSIYATSGAANVAAISVNPGPGSLTGCNGQSCQTFNIPLVTVKVCDPSNPNDCATIPNVLVDTGSSGLRLISSALSAANPNLALPPVQDVSGNNMFECMLFADGYSWGGVVSATVTVGGETTAAIPVQIIDSSAGQTEIPSACTQFSSNENDTVDSFDANGVLGVGVFDQDCGSGCVDEPQDYDVYYGCPATGTCNTNTPTETMPLADQVANPVASFQANNDGQPDNDGVIVQLPTLTATGAATASGYLVFGIGTENASATEADNHLNGATVLTADADANFTTTFSGATLQYSFIDSGSNALYFPQPTPKLALCGTTAPADEFYCPSTTTSLSATSQGINGATTAVPFQVANLNSSVLATSFAIDDVGAIATPIDIGPDGTATAAYFDWGLPFFYGRTVFTAIEGVQAEGTPGPYYAY